MEFENLLIQITGILHQSIQRYKEAVIRESRFSDITLSQIFYLEAIYHLGEPTFSELADHLQVSKASVTAGVQKLIQKGLAGKRQSSDDQRVFHLYLTGIGKDLIAAEMKAFSGFAENMKRVLSKSETDQLVKIFQKIIDRNRA